MEGRELWRIGGLVAVETRVYGGDVRTMAGGWEAGYWDDAVIVSMTDGHPLGKFTGTDRHVRAEEFRQRLVASDARWNWDAY